MDRRTIVATAGAATLTVLAGTAAIAANVGILGQRAKEPVGQLSPVAQVRPAVPVSTSPTTAAPRVETVYVDDYGPAGSARPTDASADAAAARPSATAPTAPAVPPAPVASSRTGASTPSSATAARHEGGHESDGSHESSGPREPYPGAHADD